MRPFVFLGIAALFLALCFAPFATAMAPTNAQCSSARTVQNGLPAPGFTTGSPTTRGMVPSCLGSGALDSDPVVFFQYQTSFSEGDITIDTCQGDTQMAIAAFSGPCGDLQCLEEALVDDACTSLRIPANARQPAGTMVTIAVFGNQLNPFELLVLETESCSARGPRLACETRTLQTTADRPCSGGQCGVVPGFNAGTCTVTGSDCTCDIDQISGPLPGSIVPAGSYQIVTAAQDSAGVTSNECSISLTVEPSCSPAGPSVVCQTAPIRYTTNPRCRTDDTNLQCAVLEQEALGTCSDLCGCRVVTRSGPRVGTKLQAGQYVIEVGAENDFGFVSEQTCQVVVEVTDVCDADGPSVECPDDLQFLTDPACRTADDRQCIELPPLDLGECEDLSTCRCITEQVAGPSGGSELVGGTYEITRRAVNEAGVSNLCSFNVAVSDRCSQTGPGIQNCVRNVALEVSFDCFQQTGRSCAFLPDIPAPTCQDRCGCEVEQIAGPSAGALLVVGEYEIITRAINEADFSVDCVTNVVVAAPAVPSPSASPAPQYNFENAGQQPEVRPAGADPTGARMVVTILGCDGFCSDSVIFEYTNVLAAELGVKRSDIVVESVEGNMVTFTVCCRVNINAVVQSVFASGIDQSGYSASLTQIEYYVEVPDYFEESQDVVIIRQGGNGNSGSQLVSAGVFLILAVALFVV